ICCICFPFSDALDDTISLRKRGNLLPVYPFTHLSDHCIGQSICDCFRFYTFNLDPGGNSTPQCLEKIGIALAGAGTACIIQEIS
ncbi:MAG: hypothetical protein E6230_28790, partial [Paenibacillus dendritiformis]|nr:hypothetical protein [Paenibacillus dendritiformis]